MHLKKSITTIIAVTTCCVLLTACPSRRATAPIQEGGSNTIIEEINRQTPLNIKPIKPSNSKAAVKKVLHDSFPDTQRVVIEPSEIPAVSPVISTPVIKSVSVVVPTALTTQTKNDISKKYYPVEMQDTWYGISRLHKVSLEQLAQANGITIDDLKDAKYQLKVGQTLAIPIIEPIAKTTDKLVNKQDLDAQTHTVEPQENWYSIARLYKISPVELAKFNQKNILNDTDSLKVGQAINIPSTRKSAVIVDKTTNNLNNESKILSKTLSKTPSTTSPKPLTFSFPLEGKIKTFNILKNFAQTNNKGLDFATKIHQVAQSIAPGKVIYASNQLKDYGNMLMIEHDNNWVSVYAFLNKLLVKEGEQTSQNQAIGLTDNKKMHFELRQAEKPVNPLLHLPKN